MKIFVETFSQRIKRERNEAIEKLLKEGKGTKEISESLSVNPNIVRSMASKKRISLKKNQSVKPPYWAIYLLRDLGNSIEKIARYFHTHRRNIEKVIEEKK